MEATGGLLLAAFSDPLHALAARLAAVAALPALDWPPTLLEHPLCEEFAVARPDDRGHCVREVLFRGLCVTSSVDVGHVHAAVNGATGRMSYRGRVMNRAVRVVGLASTGQVG